MVDGVHLGPLGLDKSDNDGDGGATSHPYEDDDQMDVYNLIHDGNP